MFVVSLSASLGLFALVPFGPFVGGGRVTPPTPQPITAPVHEVRMRLDPATGTLVRLPNVIGLGATEPIYDNTCGAVEFLPQQSAAQLGGPLPLASGDWGALPNQLFPGIPGQCSPGCATSYDITQFTVGYCTSAGVPVSMVLHFWDPPQGPSAGPTVIGNQDPPLIPPAFSITLNGLPRSAFQVPLAMAVCYTVNIDIGSPGFSLGSGQTIVPGAAGPRFAWSMQMLTTTGGDGPMLAGNHNFAQPCTTCAGTIWDVSGQPPDQPGVGLGQENVLFLDDYGAPANITANDFVINPAGAPWSGQYLQLGASKPCPLVGIGFPFCDGSDGSLVHCPCANPGFPNTGCDNAQATGGVGLDVLVQQTTPTNRVTMIGFGFPTMSSPTAIVIRSDQIDPLAPVVFGDGLLCIGPTPIVRLAATAATGGTSTHIFGHNSAMVGIGSFFYQIWYRNTPGTFCLQPPGFAGTSAYNTSNARRLIWSM